LYDFSTLDLGKQHGFLQHDLAFGFLQHDLRHDLGLGFLQHDLRQDFAFGFLDLAAFLGERRALRFADTAGIYI